MSGAANETDVYIDQIIEAHKKARVSNLDIRTSDQFHVVFATEGGNWSVMESGWSLEAEPGNWVRRTGKSLLDSMMSGMYQRRVKASMEPEGMIVGAWEDLQNMRRQFLVLWFK